MHCALQRCGHEWEVKICKDSGLTINQSKAILSVFSRKGPWILKTFPP